VNTLNLGFVMNQTWNQFGKTSPTLSELELDRKRKYEQLRGWVAEYLDEGAVEEFWEDLQSVLTEEMNNFNKKASYYQEVLRRLSREG